MRSVLAIFTALLAAVSAEVFMKEKFEDGWKDRWVESEWKSSSEVGKWAWTAGEWYGDKSDKGVQTSQDARFYAMSAKMDKEFDNKNKPVVIGYNVKHEQKIDCGGAYIKLLPPGFDAKKFGGDTPYSVMFGPDICGYGTRKTHAILTYKGKNLLTKKNIRVETDQLSHYYTFVINPDNTYEVLIDGAKAESGSLFEDWDFLPPKTIKDPKAKKPADWVDDAKIVDPTDVKPEGFDDVPKQIPDPNAKKPADWDDEDDGEWEPPMIDNPDFKGEWKPRMIDNPDYKGPWVHPEVANPDYYEDNEVYHVCNPCSSVGFELWQVKAGTIFDDIIVADNVEEVNEFMKATWEAKKGGEKAMFDKAEEAKRKKEEEERKKMEEERKKMEDERKKKDDDEDEDDDEDDHDEL